jgi:hypothetical protein
MWMGAGLPGGGDDDDAEDEDEDDDDDDDDDPAGGDLPSLAAPTNGARRRS